MKINRIQLAMCAGLGVLPLIACLNADAAHDTIALAGRWRLQLDHADTGVRERWFERALADGIRLPGSLPEQRIGDPVTVETKWTGGIVDRSWFTNAAYARYRQPGNVKVPFWLTPEKYYAGPAWYQREIEIPAGWSDRRVVLFLERAHWETRVWLDNKCIGTNNSLATPHVYDLGRVAPGRHTLSIRVDNRMIINIGENSHCISDHTQGNWNGIVGQIELRSTPLVLIEDLQIFPKVAEKKALVRVTIRNATGHSAQGKISLFVEPEKGAASLNVAPVSKNFDTDDKEIAAEVEIVLGERAKTWDEFAPALYRVKAEIRGEAGKKGFEDEKSATAGLREISTDGTQFLINGGKTFIRGTLECCIFPKSGYPPTEFNEWKRIISVAKAYGLNLLRFHSYCPPEAAFEAADELGIYLQVEICWANQSTALGDGRPVDQWVYDETDRILKAYGNHPSFLLMPYGNEPGGKNATAYLKAYVAHYKALDPRRLWTSGAGWPQIPENQFHVTPEPRVQKWGAGLKSRINLQAPQTESDYRDYISRRTVPVISHEIGQWCVYPNFEEIPKYTGYLKPRNFEIFRDFLNEHGMGGLAKQFLLASGKLQTLCYKEDIESALRTPGMGGFELLDLHDFPGQGTALVGVLDPFWEDKGYVTAAEYRRFCSSTVPLARFSKRVFTTDETLEAKIEIAHFGPAPMKGALTSWKLVSDRGEVFGAGAFSPANVPLGNGIALGTVSADLKRLTPPARCKLIVQVAEKGRGASRFENDWDIWVYPASGNRSSREEDEVLVTSRFDEPAESRLRIGGKVLLTIPGKQVRNFEATPVLLGFSSIFWNTAWTGRQAPTTLGILCNPAHPALAEFPTDYHSNWQWWYLIHRAGALRLDLLPPNLHPIVRVIDDWFTSRPLALVVEGKVGTGKILVCSFDLTEDAGDPVSRQMRQSLVDYMASRRFEPAAELTADQIRSLFVQ